ncbi:MAG: hypothetical protein KGL90_05360 [Burkholderiales bacterium]|nr:hypothetical protein [Burkholderiales bacterium]
MADIPHRHAPWRGQQGFSSVLVIVALVLITSLMAFGLTLTSSAQSSFAQEISSARAQQAAEAGMDWGRYQLKILAVPNCPALQNVAMPAGTLAPFTVTVRCVNNSPPGNFTDGLPPTIRIYTLSVTACVALPAGVVNCPAGQPPFTPRASYVQKSLTAWVER